MKETIFKYVGWAIGALLIMAFLAWLGDQSFFMILMAVGFAAFVASLVWKDHVK